MHFEDVEAVFKEWLYLEHDPDILRILFTIYLANRYDGLPVWAMFIGKPGCGKSELLSSLSDVDETVMISTLTQNALATGYKDGENSLLHQLSDHKVLIIKDMSTFTEMPPEARAVIFSTLRDAYDGSFVKQTGINKIKWEGKFGVLGGATPAIEKVRSYDAALGERFLSIKFRDSEVADDQIQEKSVRNNVKQTEMRKALKDATNKFFKTAKLNKDTVISQIITKAVMHSAKAMARARSSVSRDRYSREVDEMVSTSEVPTRVTNQLLLLARACLDIGTSEEATIRVIQRCCLDSIPSIRIQLLKRIIEGTEHAEKLKWLVRISRPAVDRALEDMQFLHLVDADKSRNWHIRDGALADILINTGTAEPKKDDPL